MTIKDYTLIALETTGFSPPVSHVIEIGAIKIRDGKEIERYQTLVKPPKKIPYVIECLTGIDNEILKTAPTFEEIFSDVKNFLADDILVGHNLKIDIKFLPDIKNNFIDTLQLALKAVPNLKSYGFKTLCDYFKVEPPIENRAIENCLCTNKIFRCLQA
ncbi:MAG: 3'-5' exonuclease [Selenomonadaceae bacterium]|nr:3'-5' exonuclease [Selenomonadaceae bacterium]MBQ7629821.1 3'-5' exonuclease [Selenomonadaceae bacterium]